MRIGRSISILLLAATWAGCGTTKWTDTARTATEQLLITDSIDRAVSRLDLRALAGKKVFIDETPVKQVTDNAYLLSAVRQHLLASGGILKDKRDDADYIVEIRGAIGTDRHDVLFGIPATQLPTMTMLVGAPSQIPEIPFVKKTDQHGVASISLFAYNRKTGRPIWQSGAIPEDSRAKAVWVFGAGPFQRGTLHKGTNFAGDRLHIPLIDPVLAGEESQEAVSVADQARFIEPNEPAAADPAPKDAKPGVAKEDKGAGEAKAAKAAGEVEDQAKDQAKAAPAPAKTPAGDSAVSPVSASAPILETPAFSRVIPLPPTWDPEPPSSDVYIGDTWLGRRR